MDVFSEADFNEEYKRSFYCSHFKPIITMYGDNNVEFYDETLNLLIDETYTNQYLDCLISKRTLNRRIRGLKIIE